MSIHAHTYITENVPLQPFLRTHTFTHAPTQNLCPGSWRLSLLPIPVTVDNKLENNIAMDESQSGHPTFY